MSQVQVIRRNIYRRSSRYIQPTLWRTLFIGMFLTFRDGKIASQRNYDCYPPFVTEPSA